MPGEGSMSTANVSLKNNRALAKKRKYKKAKRLLLSESQKANIEFKKVDPEQLHVIKEQIRANAKNKARKNTIINVVLALLIIALIWFLMKTMDGS